MAVTPKVAVVPPGNTTTLVGFEVMVGRFEPTILKLSSHMPVVVMLIFSDSATTATRKEESAFMPQLVEPELSALLVRVVQLKPPVAPLASYS